MIRGIVRTLVVAVLAVAAGGVAPAADPAAPKGVDTKTVVDALKDVHNYGADLYNQSKDYAGAYRVYEGALRAVRPLLASGSKAQKTIDDGLAAAGKEVDPARRAFMLHETIEAVRADLKGPGAPPKKPTTDEPKKPTEPKKPVETKPKLLPEMKRPEEPKKVDEPKKKTEEPKKPTEPKKTEEPKKVDEPKKPVETKPKTQDDSAPMPKSKEPEAAGDGAAVSGTVAFEGKPLAAGEVTFVSLDQKSPKVVTTTIKDGKYSAKGLPPGKYKVMIDGGKGGKLPAKYSTADTSGLTAEAKAGSNTINFELK